MQLLFTMSLSGTIALIFFFIFSTFTHYKMQSKWLMIILKISLFFYLCPISLLKEFIPGQIIDLVQYNFINSGDQVRLLDQVTIPKGNHLYIMTSRWFLYFLIGWFIMVVLFASYNLIKYIRIKKVVTRDSIMVEENSFPKFFYEEKFLDDNYKKFKVSVYKNSKVSSPLTIGLFRPKIIFPDKFIPEDEQKMIYLHELNHIIHRDILLKFICLIVITIHWYNPFVYLLFLKINQVSEYYCDECVVMEKNDEYRLLYGILIVKMAVVQKELAVLPVRFANPKDKLIKRLMIMRNCKRNMKWKKISTFICIMSVLVLSSISTLAYQKPLENDFDINTDDGISDVIFSSDSHDEFDPSLGLEFKDSQKIFIDEDGKIYSIPDADSQIVQRTCTHNYKPGNISYHTKNSNGSCRVDGYSCQRCSKCAGVRNKVFSYSLNSAKCKH